MSVFAGDGMNHGMKKARIRAYCRRCRHQQTFVRSEMHHGVHLLFTILTLGLWGVSWLAIYIGQLFRPWRCEHCRWHKPEFRDDRQKQAVRNQDSTDAPNPRAR